MKLAELFDVTDRITVVTGVASGIGCAYAEAMADNGGDPSKIEMADRRVEMGAAERRPAILEQRGGCARYIWTSRK